MDRNNSDFMIHCGLGLLAVAMETGADQMARLPSLIGLVRDDICRNLFSVSGGGGGGGGGGGWKMQMR